MSIAVIVLGVLNIVAVALLLILLGLLVCWLCRLFGFSEPDAQMKKVYLGFVLVVVLYMLAAMLFGMPTVHILPGLTR
jgi:hypothetical protein